MCTTKEELAAVLTRMPFGKLLKVAEQLVNMVADIQRPIDAPLGMAEMLYDWAEAQVDQ